MNTQTPQDQEKHTIQGNKLIAIFDGWKFKPMKNGKIMVSGSVYFADTPEAVDIFCGEKLQYHTSWDWLMPVYKKLTDEIDKLELRNYNPSQIIMEDCLLDADISGVYENLVDSIHWYNTNQNS